MRRFNVGGMSCAACSARVEKAVKAVEGVESCSVNLLTNSMEVSGDASDGDIIKAVKNAGYGASLKTEEKKSADENDELSFDSEIRTLKTRLVTSFAFLLVLMYNNACVQEVS